MGTVHLPLELTSFVGRAAALERIAGPLWARRLVTITGPGGIGKTRLGFRAAGSLRELYRNGAWLIDVSRAHDGPEVLRIARLRGNADGLRRGEPARG